MIKEKLEIGLFKGQLNLDRWLANQAKLDDFSEKKFPRFKIGQKVLFNDRICEVESCHQASCVGGSPYWYFLKELTSPIHEAMLREV